MLSPLAKLYLCAQWSYILTSALLAWSYTFTPTLIMDPNPPDPSFLSDYYIYPMPAHLPFLPSPQQQRR